MQGGFARRRWAFLVCPSLSKESTLCFSAVGFFKTGKITLERRLKYLRTNKNNHLSFILPEMANFGESQKLVGEMPSLPQILFPWKLLAHYI